MLNLESREDLRRRFRGRRGGRERKRETNLLTTSFTGAWSAATVEIGNSVDEISRRKVVGNSIQKVVSVDGDSSRFYAHSGVFRRRRIHCWVHWVDQRRWSGKWVRRACVELAEFKIPEKTLFKCWAKF